MKRQNNFGEKPYNRCLSCPHRKVRCDGPRTAGLELERWWEYMRDLMAINGLTNAYVAGEADLSIKTIERVLGPTPPKQDIMRDTTRRIENAIIGATSQYPCYLAFEEENSPEVQKMNDSMRELERALADNKDYRKALDDIHASYNAEMQLIRDESQRKIDFLMAQIERLQADVEHWRSENDRKGKLIDRYMDKIVSQ